MYPSKYVSVVEIKTAIIKPNNHKDPRYDLITIQEEAIPVFFLTTIYNRLLSLCCKICGFINQENTIMKYHVDQSAQ